MALMLKSSVIESPSGRSLEKAPRWDLTGTEGCDGGKVVSWLSWMFLGYMGIYRQKKYFDGAPWGPRGWGCAYPLGAPPASWKLCGLPDLYSKYPGLCLFQERSPRRFRSIWIPFDIPFLRNTEIGKKTTICTGPSVNRLVPKII